VLPTKKKVDLVTNWFHGSWSRNKLSTWQHGNWPGGNWPCDTESM